MTFDVKQFMEDHRRRVHADPAEVELAAANGAGYIRREKDAEQARAGRAAEVAATVPILVSVGVDPSGGRKDPTAIAVTLRFADGHFDALSVVSARLSFADQRRAIRRTLADAAANYPGVRIALTVDSTGLQGALSAAINELLADHFRGVRIELLPVTLTAGDGSVSELRRIKDSDPRSFSLSRAGAINAFAYAFRSGRLDLRRLPAEAAKLVDTQARGLAERNGRVDHAAGGHDDAIWALALAVAGGDHVAPYGRLINGRVSPNRRIPPTVGQALAASTYGHSSPTDGSTFSGAIASYNARRS